MGLAITSLLVLVAACWVGGIIVYITERKRREEELRSLNAALENAVEGISRLDTQGRFLSVNRAYAAALGYTPEQLQGLSWEATVYLADREKMRGAYQQMLAQGKDEIEVRGLRHDGSIFYKQVVMVKAQGSQGEFLGHHCFMKDITEKKVAEEALYRERGFLQAVLESMEEGVIACDANGVLSLFNRAAREFHARDAEPLPPDEWPRQYQLYYPGGQELLAPGNTPLIRALRGEPVRDAEIVVKSPAGENRIQLCNARALHDSSGHLLGAVVAHRDVTQERLVYETQRKLAAERDKLLQLLQLHIQRMPLAYILFDADNRVLDWNPAAEKIFGYRKDEVLNTRVLEKFVPPSAKQQTHEIIRRIQSGDMSAYSINENLTKDGRIIICEWFNTPLLTEDRQFGGVFSLAQDVTERITTEQQLRQSQKMEAFGQLAGGIAHDFNNFLTVITGYSDQLLNAIDRDDPKWGILNEIRNAAERSASLTRQLLAFSRKLVLAPRVLDLNDVVRDTEKLLRRVIGENVQLVTVLDPQSPSVKADPAQLQQVLVNLAINARDAMPQGGKLVIETHHVELDEQHAKSDSGVQPGQYAMLEVSDTGTGITAENKLHIFEPFFTTKEPGKGTGLGLAVVHSIVEQSDGHIELDNRPEDGTTFKIFLPRVENSSHAVQLVEQVTPGSRGSETILLVEDEQAVRQLTRQLLEEYGYRVLEAGDADETLRISTEHPEPIHLLVTDVVLPGIGGRLLAERLIALLPEMKVLFMSGYMDDEVVRHGVSHEQVNYLQKPFTALDLANKVQEILSTTTRTRTCI